MGSLVGAVQRGDDLTAPLGLVGVVFVLLQVLSPIPPAVGANLGSRTAAWLSDRLTTACVRPPGMGHLENPGLISDLTMARDFDLGITGPPLFISMDFIAAGLVELVGGLASAVVLAAYAWWAPLLLAGAWLATHWLLRESAVWRDRETAEVREAQRHADYAYRLAVDPAPAKEVRLFGLADWVIEQFRSRRRRLFERRGHARARDPVSPRHVRLPHLGPAGARGLRPGDSGRLVARDRRPERRRQDYHREAAVPAVRPSGRRHRSRRRRPPHARAGGMALASRRRLPGLRPLRAAAA